jgi:hypothetical protein
VKNSVNGIFIGAPREKMEEIGVSSGPLYNALYELGILREGRGQTARWTIPQDIIKRYQKLRIL